MVIPDERQISSLSLIFQIVDNSVTEIRLAGVPLLRGGKKELAMEGRL